MMHLIPKELLSYQEIIKNTCTLGRPFIQAHLPTQEQANSNINSLQFFGCGVSVNIARFVWSAWDKSLPPPDALSIFPVPVPKDKTNSVSFISWIDSLLLKHLLYESSCSISWLFGILFASKTNQFAEKKVYLFEFKYLFFLLSATHVWPTLGDISRSYFNSVACQAHLAWVKQVQCWPIF